MNEKWLITLLTGIMIVGYGSLAMATTDGRVFDSATGEVITGAVVTLIPIDGGAITPTPPVGTTGTNPQTVGPLGFSWAAQEGKSFALSVTAIGYQFPTVQTTWQSAWTSMGFTDVTGANAFLGNTWAQPPVMVTIDIPLDPITETVSIPTQPNGSGLGELGVSYDYSTGGASSNLGHPVEYQFDWGEMSSAFSIWTSSPPVSKSWTSAGSYTVKARARCATHTSIVSDWSAGFVVVISEGSDAIEGRRHGFCGLLGIEPLLLIGLVILLRRNKRIISAFSAPLR